MRGALSHVGDLLGLQEHLPLALLVGDRRAEEHDRVAEPEHVTVAQRTLLRHALAIQVRAIAGLVVGQRPFLFGTEQMGVPARYLAVP